MPRAADLKGRKSGSLVAVKRVEKPEKYPLKCNCAVWLCRCECGKEMILPSQYITRETIKSCGCKGDEEHGELQDLQTAEVLEAKPEEPKKPKLWGVKAIVAKCEECRKPFERPYFQWGYTIGSKLFCTYKCMRSYERR